MFTFFFYISFCGSINYYYFIIIIINQIQNLIAIKWLSTKEGKSFPYNNLTTLDQKLGRAIKWYPLGVRKSHRKEIKYFSPLFINESISWSTKQGIQQKEHPTLRQNQN